MGKRKSTTCESEVVVPKEEFETPKESKKKRKHRKSQQEDQLEEYQEPQSLTKNGYHSENELLEEQMESAENGELDEIDLALQQCQEIEGGGPVMYKKEDYLKMFQRIQEQKQAIHNRSCFGGLERLDWNSIAFGEYTPEVCKYYAQRLLAKMRKFRTLEELVEEALDDLNRRKVFRPPVKKKPCNPTMLYFLDKKDTFVSKYPDKSGAQLLKEASAKFKSLSDRKKAKYIDRYKEAKSKHEKLMDKLITVEPVQKNLKRGPARLLPDEYGLIKPISPIQLYTLHKKETDQEPKMAPYYKERYLKMSDKKKFKWIKKVYEAEQEYRLQLKKMHMENPTDVKYAFKTTLSTNDVALYDRMVGNPKKPPKNGYCLFMEVMADLPDLEGKSGHERMKIFSEHWNKLSLNEKEEWNEKSRKVYVEYCESMKRRTVGLGPLELDMLLEDNPVYACYLKKLENDKIDYEKAAFVPQKTKTISKKGSIKAGIACSSSDEDN